jgi:hypothetical protein
VNGCALLIGLIIAVDAPARKFDARLLKAVDVLERHHGLSVGVCLVGAGEVSWLRARTTNKSFVHDSDSNLIGGCAR